MTPTYHAILYDPTVPPPEPDKYGTLTLPPPTSCTSASFTGAKKWAEEILKTAGQGSSVDITKTETVFVARIDKAKEDYATTNPK